MKYGNESIRPNQIVCFIASMIVALSTLTSIAGEEANASANQGPSATSVGKQFGDPPPKYGPHCFVERMNGNITREGLTQDLRAMKRVGIAGFHMFDISYGKAGPAQYGSRAWKDLLKHTFAEARRLGLEAYINNCAGWSGSGGPWVKPQHAMYEIVWQEKVLNGPAKPPIMVARPAAAHGYYRDIAVLAVPLPNTDAIRQADKNLSRVKIESPGTKIANPKVLFDNNSETGVGFSPPRNRKTLFINMEYPVPVKVTSIHLRSYRRARGKLKGVLQYSEDGKKYKDICSVSLGGRHKEPHTYRFKGKAARFFRLKVEGGAVELKELRLDHRPVIDRWEEKSGLSYISGHGGGFGEIVRDLHNNYLNDQHQNAGRDNVDQAIPAKGVVDITKHMDGQGRLSWAVPQGRWLVLRVGYRPTGRENAPAPVSGRGLACDKLSSEAAEVYMKGFFKNILDDDATNVTGVLFDSWEVGAQNWTHRMRDEFKQRCGYDLLPYLPVLAGGRVVGSTEISERFLWDFRRTIADLIAEAYYGTMTKICAKAGLGMYAEGAGKQQFMADPASYQSQVGVPVGEFWTSLEEPRPDCKASASIAHIYGKKLVGAEAFTAHPQHGKWLNHPFKLKVLGDRAFANGVNQFLFHRYAQQPWTDRVPGMTMGKWGFHFERTITWWEQSTAWIKYLSRCQYMLQEGQSQVDVCYLSDGGAPSYVRRHSELDPPLPKGFDYDGSSTSALMNLMTVEKGDIKTRGGARYRLLVLPPTRCMQPDVLSKLAKLVADGGTIVGPKPLFSPSLKGYPQCDQEVTRLAGLLWGNCDGQKTIMNRYGKGRVFWTRSLAPVFKELNLNPDVTFSSSQRDSDFRWIHRRWGDRDIYFVANSRYRFEHCQASFRCSGKTPMLLDPITGTVMHAPVYHQQDGRVILPFRFSPAGSVFVVFVPSEGVDRSRAIRAISRDGVVVQSCTQDPRFKAFESYSQYRTDVMPKEELAKEELIPGYDVAGDNALHAKQIYQAVGYYPICVPRIKDGGLYLSAWKPGRYDLTLGNGKDQSLTIAAIPDPVAVQAPWQVQFLAEWGPKEPVTFGELQSWSVDRNPSIKYYSGTAVYKNKMTFSSDRLKPDIRLFLDLGRVEVIAEVSLNGRDLGVLWKPPYRVEITDVVQAGENQLDVKVTNLWPNRLIGDENIKDKSKRVTYATFKHYDKNSPLLDSGLLGPVKVHCVVEKAIAVDGNKE